MSVVTFRLEIDMERGHRAIHVIPTSTVRQARIAYIGFDMQAIVVDTSEGIKHEIDAGNMTPEQRLQAVADLDHGAAPDELDIAWLCYVEEVAVGARRRWQRTVGARE